MQTNKKHNNKTITYDCGVQPIANPTKPLNNKIHIKLGAIALNKP